MRIKSYFKQYQGIVVQAVLFLVVGLVTLLVDVLVTNTLYSVFHMPAVFASAVGFLSGFSFNFPMNRKKVFRHTDSDRFSLHVQVMQYTLLSIFNLIMTSLIVGFLTDSGVIAIQYAKILVTAVFAVWNFLLFKFLIFSKDNKK